MRLFNDDRAKEREVRHDPDGDDNKPFDNGRRQSKKSDRLMASFYRRGQVISEKS
jgi:hypothetical protein